MPYDFQRCRLRWTHNAVLDDHKDNIFGIIFVDIMNLPLPRSNTVPMALCLIYDN